jgi:hypothetical protein
MRTPEENEAFYKKVDDALLSGLATPYVAKELHLTERFVRRRKAGLVRAGALTATPGQQSPEVNYDNHTSR